MSEQKKEEEKPFQTTPSGMPDPRFPQPKQKDVKQGRGQMPNDKPSADLALPETQFDKLKREGGLFIRHVTSDYRFWIFVSGFLLGFIAGRF